MPWCACEAPLTAIQSYQVDAYRGVGSFRLCGGRGLDGCSGPVGFAGQRPHPFRHVPAPLLVAAKQYLPILYLEHAHGNASTRCQLNPFGNRLRGAKQGGRSDRLRFSCWR